MALTHLTAVPAFYRAPEPCRCSECRALAGEYPADGEQLRLAVISSGEPAGSGSPSPFDAPADPAADVSNPKAALSKQRSRPQQEARPGRRAGAPKPETLHA